MENFYSSSFNLSTSLNGKKLKIFTWHIHGSYLFYLSKGNYDIYIPVKDIKEDGFWGRGETFPFGENVHEVHVDDLKYLEFDVILFQSPRNYLTDQFDILTEDQRRLPKIYLEHDPPLEGPTETRHVVDDQNILLVHVTHYNKIMWNNNRTPAKVIDHGVVVPAKKYTGEKERGIVVINNIHKRGRRLGLDVFREVEKRVPVDLIGMGSEGFGLGEVKHPDLPEFISKYRFFFNPIRYTSLGLSVIEAMMLGIPVVGLATTELPTVIRDGVSGFVHTNVEYLVRKMQLLLDDRELAVSLGREGQRSVNERFNISRFVNDWEVTFNEVVQRLPSSSLSETL
ncbi:MAG TPA: glycosyltransferase family 4 protein [Sphingobacteriaceae bacterium]